MLPHSHPTRRHHAAPSSFLTATPPLGDVYTGSLATSIAAARLQLNSLDDAAYAQQAWSRAQARVLAAPSRWDQVEVGASELKAALADAQLTDAAWLAQLADKGGVLPRRQDVPRCARVTLAEMEKWRCRYTLGVLVVSYPWWALLPSTPCTDPLLHGAPWLTAPTVFVTQARCRPPG